MSPVLSAQLALLPDYLGRHLLLSVTALGIGVALSLPLALLVTRRQALRGPVLMLASVIQTIPGLALLALMVPLLSRIGFLPALLALILYSCLPVLRNAVTGIEEVDANLIEAGRGLGMTEAQVLAKVQLPLAMPVIIAGIRTAAVWVVGMTTLSTPVGATSLGNYIFSGLQTQNYTAVLVGCAAAALLALLLDGLIRGVEVAAQKRSRLLLCATLAGAALAIGAGLWPVVGGSFRAGGDAPEVVIGAKTFTEQYILANVIARSLEQAGFRTRTLDSLGSTVVFDALAAGRIDVYVDYTGTIWANYMDATGNPGRQAILERTTRWLQDEHDVTIAARLGFENAYAIAMTEARAEELGVRTIGDLGALAPGLRIGGDYEFFSRPEWTALEASYELEFRELVSMDSTLMYAAVAAGEVDVISAFSTDGRIPAFELVLIEDTRGALPPYDAVVLVRGDASDELLAALSVFENAIDGEAMRDANRLVDLEGGSIGDAVRSLSGRIETQAP